MKRLSKLFFAVAMAFALILPTVQVEAKSGFTDVGPGYVYYNEIMFLKERGIISGYDDGSFRPNEPVNRIQTARMLMKAFGLDSTNSPKPEFSDIKQDYYAYDVVAAVADKNIFKGDNGKFNPGATLTRAHMAAVLQNSFYLDGEWDGDFEDVDASHWSYGAIHSLVANGIANGQVDKFNGHKPTTRAHFAVFLAKAIQNYEEETKDVMEVVRKALNKQVDIKTSEFSSSMKLNLSMPESMLADPELAKAVGMINGMDIEITGVQQLNPMKLEMNMKFKSGGLSVDLPMILTEDKMYIKLPVLPEMPGIPALPEEVKGKFIEIDLNDPTLVGEADAMMPIDVTDPAYAEFGKAMNEILLSHFNERYFSFVGADKFAVPSHIRADHLVKFEINNKNFEQAIEDFVKGVVPDMLTFIVLSGLEDLDLSEEELAMIIEELQSENSELDAMIDELMSIVQMGHFTSYFAIDNFYNIVYNVIDADVSALIEGEKFGFKFHGESEYGKFDKKPNFKIGIPSADKVVPIDVFLELLYSFEEE